MLNFVLFYIFTSQKPPKGRDNFKLVRQMKSLDFFVKALILYNRPNCFFAKNGFSTEIVRREEV